MEAAALVVEVHLETGKYPKWIQSLASTDQIQKLEAQIHTQESKSTGEIAVVIARKSSATHFVAPLLGLILYLFFETVLLRFFLEWILWHFSFLNWAVTLLNFSLSFSLGYWLSHFPMFQRMCIPNAMERTQCETRAFAEFQKQGVGKTGKQTGVLIFVSLMERQVLVLGDHTIASKVPATAWEDIIKSMVSDMKNGRLALGIDTGIQRVGEILAKEFPASLENKDELSNEIRFLES